MNTLKNPLRIIAIVIFLLFVNGNAYSQTWNDMVRWLQTDGAMKTLAVLAHPIDGSDDVDFRFVSANNSEVVIKITYEGFLSYYTDTYTIVRGDYNGQAYFKRIRTVQPPCQATCAFQSLGSSWASAWSRYFSELGLGKLYSSPYYQDLSDGERGAFALFVHFLIYWNS